MGVQQQQAPPKPRPPKPVSEARRIRKPLMERKRRERINTSLNDLALLLTEAQLVKSESGGRPAKLEKADILELTVKHIRTLKTSQQLTEEGEGGANILKEGEEDTEGRGISSSPASGKYREGFSRCMTLVEQTLRAAGKETMKERLLDHLRTCLSNLNFPATPLKTSTSVAPPVKQESNARVDSASEESAASATEEEDEEEIARDIEESQRLTLTPTRLPSGALAFVIQGPLNPSLLLPQSPPPPSPPPPSPSPSPSPTTTTSSSSSFIQTPLKSPETPPKYTSTSTQCHSTQSSTSSTTPFHTTTTSTRHHLPLNSTTITTLHTPTSSSTSVSTYSTPTGLPCFTHTTVHTPPTPPPSVSPYAHYQMQMEEEMEMEVEQVEQRTETDSSQPFDLSFKKMWRPW